MSTIEIETLREKLATVLRVEASLRETLARAVEALKTARASLRREAWQDGPTIEAAIHELGKAIDDARHDFTVENAENQLRFAARKALEYKGQADTLARLRVIAGTMSPGPFQWGIFPEEGGADYVTDALAHGSGPIHMVGLPGHAKSDIGPNPLAPNHLVHMCITGNGPTSEANAKGIIEILSVLNQGSKGEGE